MKKWGWKKISAMGLVLSLALSTTAFASGTATESMQQTETEMETEETENGLESQLFVAEQDLEEDVSGRNESGNEEPEKIRSITLEELEKIDKDSVFDEGKISEMPQTAIIVFQKEGFWKQEEMPEEMSETEEIPEETQMMTEKQSVETVLDPAKEEETGEETENSTEQEKECPVVMLSENQEETVEKTASLVKETVVVINGATLENELMFKEQENVKAVLFMNEKSEEAFKEAIEDMDFAQVYADYQKKIEEDVETEKRTEKKTAIRVETEKTQVESILPGSTLAKSSGSSTGTSTAQTPSTTDTEKNTEASDLSLNKETNASSGGTQTTIKEIKIDMIFDPDYLLMEGDDALYVMYKMSCPDDVKITEASFKLTYDSTKMSYDSEYSSEGEDIDTEDFKFTSTDNVGSVTINMKQQSGSTQVLKGSFLDLGFELKQEAKVGDLYNLKLEVTSMKASGTEINNNNDYKITINEESIKAIAYADDEGDGSEQTETQPQTQPQTQTQTETQTQTQTQTLQKAAKTDDTTDTALWIILLAASAIVFGNTVFRKKTA